MVDGNWKIISVDLVQNCSGTLVDTNKKTYFDIDKDIFISLAVQNNGVYWGPNYNNFKRDALTAEFLCIGYNNSISDGTIVDYNVTTPLIFPSTGFDNKIRTAGTVGAAAVPIEYGVYETPVLKYANNEYHRERIEFVDFSLATSSTHTLTALAQELRTTR